MKEETYHNAKRRKAKDLPLWLNGPSKEKKRKKEEETDKTRWATARAKAVSFDSHGEMLETWKS